MDTATGRELKTLLRRGEDALLRRDYERASTYFRRAYTADPGNITAITNLGYTYARMGRFSHAQKCFITALDIDPDNPVARKNLSLLMKPDKERRSSGISQGKGRTGEELFLRYMEWGNLQMEQRNFFAAIQYYKEASKIHPDFIEPYLNIGICYEELREYAAAVGAFSDALDIFPKDPVAQEHLDRCRGLTESGDYPQYPERKYTPYTPPSIPPGRPGTSSPPPVPQPVLQEEPLSPSLLSGITPSSEKPVSTEASGTGSSPVSGKPSDDEVIKSILNQYSGLMTPDKKPEPDAHTEEKMVPELVNDAQEIAAYTPPKANTSTPVSSDDIVSSILMQYQEDLIGTEEESEPATQKAEEGTDVPYTGQAPLSEEGDQVKQKDKQGIRVDLNDDQKDALRELGNIGASHAATTLSTMLNTPIMLNVPEIMITDFEHINQLIPQENSAMGIFTMEGQMAKAGYVILHVPRESVVLMTSIMLGMPIEPARELNEMDESAITEIGNIMVSAFLDGTAELLGIIMLPSPPRTIFDIPQNVFDLIIKESNILYDNVVFFRTELICDEHELNLNIFMLPNPPVLQEIVRMLEKIIEDSAMG